MKILQQFKYSFLLLLSLSINANDAFINFGQKFMDADWSFLPEVPASFNENNSKEMELGFSVNNIKTTLYTNKIDLSLQRTSEPKDVSLVAEKNAIEVGYVFQNENYLYILASDQKADSQKFACYEFSAFIIGECDSANLQINSTNPKYQSLEGSLISITGSTKSIGLGYQWLIDRFWFESVALELQTTEYNYDWLTPLEDIQSPFLLNFSINGVRLGDVLDSTLLTLPQRQTWKTSQLNLRLIQNFQLKNGLSLFFEHNLIALDYSNYSKINKAPSTNFKLRAGLEYRSGQISMQFYGDAYLNNLIGFEPITFNQRTEHYFNDAYAELGMQLSIAF